MLKERLQHAEKVGCIDAVLATGRYALVGSSSDVNTMDLSSPLHALLMHRALPSCPAMLVPNIHRLVTRWHSGWRRGSCRQSAAASGWVRPVQHVVTTWPLASLLQQPQ